MEFVKLSALVARTQEEMMSGAVGDNVACLVRVLRGVCREIEDGVIGNRVYWLYFLQRLSNQFSVGDMRKFADILEHAADGLECFSDLDERSRLKLETLLEAMRRLAHIEEGYGKSLLISDFL